MARYTRREEIGRGTWGVVYTATDEITNGIVAIKVFDEGVALPKRELELGRQVTHENVCRIYDYVIDEDGSSYIAMEYVDGGSLRKFIQRSGALPLETALRIAHETLNGLEAIHFKGIVHRDLKPENILLTSKGQAKVSDFGNARQAGAMPSLESQPESGTPAYRPREAYDIRSDIYAFGVVLHEMLSAADPRWVTPPPLPSGLPAYVEVAVSRCLDLHPAGRFASVAELREALTGPPPRRRAPAVTGILTACLCAVLSLSVLLWRSARVQNVQEVQAAKPFPSPVINHLPTVAVFFDGPVGDSLTDALLHGGRFQLVERQKLDKVLSEIDLSRDAVDSEVAVRVGKLIGAQYLLFGSVQDLGSSTIRINARLVHTETSAVVGGEWISGEASNVKRLAEELARRFHV